MVIKFNLTNDFKTVPEGTRILEIVKAEAKPSGKPTAMHLTFKDSEGGFINNRYDFNSNGGLTAFAILCRIALSMPDASEFDTVVDTPKLIGKKLNCEVIHSQGSQPREDGTFPIFANIAKVISLSEETIQPTNNVTENVNPRLSIIGDDLM